MAPAQTKEHGFSIAHGVEPIYPQYPFQFPFCELRRSEQAPRSRGWRVSGERIAAAALPLVPAYSASILSRSYLIAMDAFVQTGSLPLCFSLTGLRSLKTVGNALCNVPGTRYRRSSLALWNATQRVPYRTLTLTYFRHLNCQILCGLLPSIIAS